MSGLWMGAAALFGVAVLFVWLPVLRRKRVPVAPSQMVQNVDIFRERVAEIERDRDAGTITAAQFEQLKLELERGLLMEAESAGSETQLHGLARPWVPALVLTVLVPAGAFLLYQDWGAADRLELALQMRGVAESSSDGQRAEAVDDLIRGLEARVRADPENLEDHYLLARSHLEIGDYDQAAATYRDLMKLAGEQPELLAEYGQALFFAADRVLTPEAEGALSRALELAPENRIALGMLGMGLYGRGDFASALKLWERALALATPGPGREALERGIESARMQLQMAGAAPSTDSVPAVAKTGSTDSAAGSSLKVLVEAAPEVLAGIDKATSVFIFARSPDGPPMPLAVARLQVADLPALVTLDDSMAMTPMARLSMVERVNVVARIAMGGTPQAQAGDFQGLREGVVVADQDEVLKLLIQDPVI